MKLNFLNVMNKKASPDEIAEQIVALEIKQKECERDRDISKILCKEVRGKTLCGERISPEIIRNADKDHDEAVLNLEIVTESIEDLKSKLTQAVNVHRDEEAKRLAEMRKRIDREMEKAKLELAKAKGRLVGLAIGIYGHSAAAQRHLEDSRSFTYTRADQFYEDFDIEERKAVAELRRPSVADLLDEAQQKDRWLQLFNVDEECSRVLKKYRDIHCAEVSAIKENEV